MEKAKFFSENTSRSLSNTIESGKEEQPLHYLRTLVPEDQEQAIIKPSLPSNVVSLSSLRALPLLDQCKMLLKDGKKMENASVVCANRVFLCSSENYFVPTTVDAISWL